MRKVLIAAAVSALALGGAVAATTASAAPGGAETATVSVPANDPAGVNTGVNVNSQKTVTVTVSGTVNVGGGQTAVSPAGTSAFGACPIGGNRECLANDARIGQVVYKVGDDGTWAKLPVGGVITSKTGGLVYLGVNDVTEVAAYADNSGAFSATVVRAPAA